SSTRGHGNSTLTSTEQQPFHRFRRYGGKGAPGRVRGSDEPASLVATAELLQADRATKLGRSILPNPSCPPTPSGAEHAKKPEPIQARLSTDLQRRTGWEIPNRLKKLTFSHSRRSERMPKQ